MKTRSIDPDKFPGPRSVLVQQDEKSMVLVDHVIHAKGTVCVVPKVGVDHEMPIRELVEGWQEVVGEDAAYLRRTHWPTFCPGVLLIGESPILNRVGAALGDDVRVYWAANEGAAEEILREEYLEIILMEHAPPENDGIERLRAVHARDPSLQFIVLCRGQTPEVTACLAEGLAQKHFLGDEDPSHIAAYIDDLAAELVLRETSG